MPVEVQRLRTVFREELAVVCARFPRVKGTRLFVVAKHFEPGAGARDLAWYDPSTRGVYVVRAALARSEGTLRGVIRHELGHAADRRIDEPGAERRADRLSEKATGQPIRYRGEGLQHAFRGKVGRPGWLHQ